jgi:hypothetical protein
VVSSSRFVLSSRLFIYCHTNIHIQLAYKPLITPLLQQALQLREAGKSWTIVDGLEILPEQGIVQFELMTGRKAPRGRMRLEVLRRYQEDEEGTGKPSIDSTGANRDNTELWKRFEKSMMIG